MIDYAFGFAYKVKKALKEKGIDSMLADARNDMKDTDVAAYISKNCTPSPAPSQITISTNFQEENEMIPILMGSHTFLTQMGYVALSKARLFETTASSSLHDFRTFPQKHGG